MDTMNITDQAIEWFARIRSDQVSKETLDQFVQWLKRDQRHQVEFRELVEFWDGLAIIKEMDFPELSEFPILWGGKSSGEEKQPADRET